MAYAVGDASAVLVLTGAVLTMLELPPVAATEGEVGLIEGAELDAAATLLVLAATLEEALPLLVAPVALTDGDAEALETAELKADLELETVLLALEAAGLEALLVLLAP